VTPQCEGKIFIKGIKYLLERVVPGIHDFQKRGRRLNDTKEQRTSVTYAADTSLVYTVAPRMPLLDVQFQQFPETLFSGEVIKTVLIIANKGERALTSLKLKCSHPSFFCLSSAMHLEKEAYGTYPCEKSMRSLILTLADRLFPF
jgi:hypothetical protein